MVKQFVIKFFYWFIDIKGGVARLHIDFTDLVYIVSHRVLATWSSGCVFGVIWLNNEGRLGPISDSY